MGYEDRPECVGALSPEPALMAACSYLWSLTGASLMNDSCFRQIFTQPSSPLQGCTACPNPGTGLEKVGLNKSHSKSPCEGNRALRGIPVCSRIKRCNLKLRVGTWNVRTMIDSVTDGVTARPHRRTGLIAHELNRFGVDITALSETRLSGEGSLTEVGSGFTFFLEGVSRGAASPAWRGHSDQVLDHG